MNESRKIRFIGLRLHKMLPFPTPCSGRQWIRVNASFRRDFLKKLTHFLSEGGLALNSQGDALKMNIPVSRAMLRSTVGSCSCVNLQ